MKMHVWSRGDGQEYDFVKALYNRGDKRLYEYHYENLVERTL